VALGTVERKNTGIGIVHCPRKRKMMAGKSKTRPINLAETEAETRNTMTTAAVMVILRQSASDKSESQL
jgi:hypothetical protein